MPLHTASSQFILPLFMVLVIYVLYQVGTSAGGQIEPGPGISITLRFKHYRNNNVSAIIKYYTRS